MDKETEFGEPKATSNLNPGTWALEFMPLTPRLSCCWGTDCTGSGLSPECRLELQAWLWNSGEPRDQKFGSECLEKVKSRQGPDEVQCPEKASGTSRGGENTDGQGWRQHVQQGSGAW